MRRTLSLVLLATLITLVPASAASGGGNWLEFREDPRAGASRAADGTLGTWAILHVGQRVVSATGPTRPIHGAGIWRMRGPSTPG